MEKNRLTVVETSSFQEAGNPVPVVADSRYSVQLESDDQAYQRRVTIGEEWRPLNLGWVESPCEIVVHCMRKTWATQPSEEEQLEADKAILELTFEPPTVDIIVLSGRSARFCPGRPMQLRCRSGQTRVQITAFPS